MTDHDNADDADGQNSKLSRRTALGLMGASAVGGAAASSAYSQLTADRPVDVEVVQNGAVEASEGDSTLEITNNEADEIDAEVATADGDVSLIDSSGATVSGENPWTVEDIPGEGASATLEFGHDIQETTVDFDVSAFTTVDGFGINTVQPVNVAPDNFPDGLVSRWSLDAGSGNEIIDEEGDNDGTREGDTRWESDETVGNYLNFNSEEEDGFVGVPSDESLDIANELSVSVWIRFDEIDGSGGIWSSHGSSANTGVTFRVSSSGIKYRVNDNNYPFSFDTSEIIGEWTHLSTRIEGEESARLIVHDVDGNELTDETINIDDGWSVPEQFHRIGGVSWIDSENIFGDMRNLNVYERALTEDELADEHIRVSWT